MNFTLNEYIERSNSIINIINSKSTDKLGISLSKHNLKNEFEGMIHNIESTLNVIKEQYEKFSVKVDDKLSELVLDDVKLNNNMVILDVEPKCDFSFNKQINQYILTIDNLTLRGNIGNVYMRGNAESYQLVPCSKRNKCFNILKESYCKFWHDPVDLLKLKNNNVISDVFYNDCIKLTRNFNAMAWLYDGGKNPYMRCIGSKESLDMDLINLTKWADRKERIDNMKQQVIHDILILLYLNKYGLA